MAADGTGGRSRPRFLLPVLLGIGFAGIAGAIVIPNLLAANLCGAYETAAIATLRNLAYVQEQLRASGRVDVDGDGKGEFGSLRELTGGVPLRAAPGKTGAPLSPPLLSPALLRVTTEGWVEKSHYAYAIFLPRAGGGWVRETGDVAAERAAASKGCSGSGNAAPGSPGVSSVGAVDPDRAETEWCAIAWPRMIGEKTRRMFVVTAQGEVLQCPNARGLFCGTVLPCGPPDVLPPGWKPGDPVVGGYTSRDGEVWIPTN